MYGQVLVKYLIIFASFGNDRASMQLRSGVGIKLSRNVLTTRQELRHSVLIAGFSSASMYPGLIKICGKVSNPGYNHSPRSRDRVLHVGRIDGIVDTVLVFVLISGKDYDISKFEWTPSIITTAEFQFFLIHVGCCRVSLPGLNFGQSAYAVSAPIQVNKMDVTDNKMESEKPMSNEQCVQFLERCYDGLVKLVAEWLFVRNLPHLVYQVGDVASVTPRLPMLAE
jgi:hypothetical protein